MSRENEPKITSQQEMQQVLRIRSTQDPLTELPETWITDGTVTAPNDWPDTGSGLTLVADGDLPPIPPIPPLSYNPPPPVPRIGCHIEIDYDRMSRVKAMAETTRRPDLPLRLTELAVVRGIVGASLVYRDRVHVTSVKVTETQGSGSNA